MSGKAPAAAVLIDDGIDVNDSDDEDQKCPSNQLLWAKNILGYAENMVRNIDHHGSPKDKNFRDAWRKWLDDLKYISSQGLSQKWQSREVKTFMEEVVDSIVGMQTVEVDPQEKARLRKLLDEEKLGRCVLCGSEEHCNMNVMQCIRCPGYSSSEMLKGTSELETAHQRYKKEEAQYKIMEDYDRREFNIDRDYVGLFPAGCQCTNLFKRMIVARNLPLCLMHEAYDRLDRAQSKKPPVKFYRNRWQLFTDDDAEQLLHVMDNLKEGIRNADIEVPNTPFPGFFDKVYFDYLQSTIDKRIDNSEEDGDDTEEGRWFARLRIGAAQAKRTLEGDIPTEEEPKEEPKKEPKKKTAKPKKPAGKAKANPVKKRSRVVEESDDGSDDDSDNSDDEESECPIVSDGEDLVYEDDCDEDSRPREKRPVRAAAAAAKKPNKKPKTSKEEAGPSEPAEPAEPAASAGSSTSSNWSDVVALLQLYKLAADLAKDDDPQSKERAAVVSKGAEALSRFVNVV